MKEISKKTKIIALIIAIIILVGIIIIATMGLKFDLINQKAQGIQLYLEKNFEISDMQEITNETLPNQEVVIQKVEVYEDTVKILTNQITEEQKAEIIKKVNEKYGTELTADNIEITDIAHTRGRDIIKPYIIPFAIATVIILVYMAVRYHKLGMIKTILQTALLLIIAQATLLSIIAIARIPIGRITIPLVFIVYVLSLVGVTTYLEKNLKEKKKEEE